MKNKNCICIIPARGGSKRIKYKNLQKINKIPSIVHVIKIAKKSKIFDKIIVSTDSKKIKLISEKNGASTYDLRKKDLANDHVGTDEVLRYELSKNKLQNYKYLACIYPTAVLLKINDLRSAFKKIKRLRYKKLISVKEFESSPLRGYFLNNNMLRDLAIQFKEYRSQDLKKFYFDTGYFYFYEIKSFLKNKNLKSTFYILNKFSSYDINENNDLIFIKKNFKFLKKI